MPYRYPEILRCGPQKKTGTSNDSSGFTYPDHALIWSAAGPGPENTSTHGPKSSRGPVVRKKRVFYVVMVHPFVAIQAFLPPVLRTAAEIYFRAAGGRASFLLVPATRQTPIARIYSLAFCCARLRRSCSSCCSARSRACPSFHGGIRCAGAIYML